MKKAFIEFLSIVLCFSFLIGSNCIFANEIDPSKKCSLTLTYTKENKVFPNLEIKIYRIAKLTNESEFEMTEPFDAYPVKVNGITSQAEWNEVASTLRGYIDADGIIPYRVQKTDVNGKAEFKDLDAGLYLVGEVSAEADSVSYVFYDSMMVLPSYDGESYTYDVDAKPKSRQSEPSKEEKTYTVLKLWKDEGNTANRPDSVTVDIIKNGRVAETIVLSPLNNWTYTFTCSDESSLSVVERNVAKEYTVKVTEKDSSFVIINTREYPQNERPANPPQTGDTFPLGFWILVLCISGLSLIVLGVIQRREKA